MTKNIIQLLKSLFKKNAVHTIPTVALLDKNTPRPLPPIPEELLQEYFNLRSNLQLQHENEFAKLRRIYDFLDLYKDFASTFSVCKKGCSACCKSDVNMTKLEAIYIEKNSNHVARRTKKNTRKHKTPCPFLVDNSCSTYEHRPINCRTLYTLDDPKYCETKEAHQLYGANGGKGINIIYTLKEYSEKLNGTNGSADIRDYFT